MTATAKGTQSDGTQSDGSQSDGSTRHDPIGLLVEALLEERLPDDNWMRWRSRPDDPVAAAWQQSRAYALMLQLLYHRWPAFEALAQRAAEAAVHASTVRWKIWRPPAPRGPFAPNPTEWPPRLPAQLTRWLHDYARGAPQKTAHLASAIRRAVPAPPSPDELTYRLAGAYLLGERIALHAQAGWGGYYVVTEPTVGLGLDADNAALGQGIERVLAAHTPSLPEDVAPARAMRPVLAELGARSQRALQSAAQHCWLESNAHGFIITPTHNGGTRGEGRGFSPLAKRALGLDRDATDADLGAALKAAFARCS